MHCHDLRELLPSTGQEGTPGSIDGIAEDRPRSKFPGGNWDLAGVWIVQRAGTPTVVAERLQPESLFRRFVRFREGLGFEIVPLTGGTLRHRWNS